MMQQIKMMKEDIIRRLCETHHLSRREDPSELYRVLRTVGFQSPDEHSLGIALCARMKDPMALDLTDAKLLCTVGVRSAVRTIRTDEWTVFNKPFFPASEEELTHMISGATELLAPLGMRAVHWLHMTVDLLSQVLSERSLAKRELGIALASEAADLMDAATREIWTWPSVLFRGQTLGETLMRFLLPVASFAVPLRLRFDRQLGGFHYSLAKDVGVDAASDHPVRRFLHAYGPADRDAYALWAGISAAHATRHWEQIPQEELAQVEFEGKQSWMLVQDTHMESADPEGIRFIGPFDPLLRIPHRSLLIRGKQQYRYFFRSSGKPGMVLSDGTCVAGWHIRRKKRSWTMLLEDIGGPIGRLAVDELEQEARRLEPVFGSRCDGVSFLR